VRRLSGQGPQESIEVHPAHSQACCGIGCRESGIGNVFFGNHLHAYQKLAFTRKYRAARRRDRRRVGEVLQDCSDPEWQNMHGCQGMSFLFAQARVSENARPR
jgi:hypothetical protein